MKENNRKPDNRNIRSNNQRTIPNRSHHNLLPSPKILEEYENMAPGSVNKLLEMAKKEQDHRHSWQDRYLKLYNINYKIGLLFGFIYNVGLLFIIFNLVKQGNQPLALRLFVINALLITFAIIATNIERKIITRKPPRRIYPNKDHQPFSKTNPTFVK